MIRKFVVTVMSVALVAGLSFAQEEEEKVEKTPEQNPIVKIQTNHGDIYLEVFLNETPIHAQNFLSKVDDGKYDSLIFHRVVKGFVIQGGDPSGTGSGSMGPDRLADEKSPFPQVRGTVAMARSREGASNCQFYINLGDNTRLDKDFSSFARVVHGMDVADEISVVEATGPRNETPVEKVVMQTLSKVDKIPEEPKGE